MADQLETQPARLPSRQSGVLSQFLRVCVLFNPRSASRSSRILLLAAIFLAALNACADESTEPSLSEWVKTQTDNGLLKLNFYDPDKPRPFPGWTVFEYRLEFKYDCQVVWPRKKPRAGAVTLIPNFTKIDIPITHHMDLPKVLESDRWFESVLARHELEHVRVGSHPRLVMLAKHLVKKIKRIERTVEKPGDVTTEWMQEQVEAELKLRKDAIHKLVRDINDHIDDVTEHGAATLEDRENFFSNLYLKANLDDMKFPYLSEVLDLLETREYQKASIQIREIDDKHADVPRK